MADSQKKTTSKKQETEMADVLFKKYVRSTIRTLGSTEFYNSFMNAMANAQNTFRKRLSRVAQRTTDLLPFPRARICAPITKNKKIIS